MMADVSDKFVHDVVYKAFLGMTCLEMGRTWWQLLHRAGVLQGVQSQRQDCN